MSNELQHHDFVVAIKVDGANPNGDPANDNQPRQNYEGFGEMSSLCVKRKIRNALFHMNEKIFLISDELAEDDNHSIEKTIETVIGKSKNLSVREQKEMMLRNFIDARLFGFVVAIKKATEKKGNSTKKDSNNDQDSNDEKSVVNMNQRGAVTIHDAVSLVPIDIIETQITKSVTTSKTGEGKGSDTMGKKYKTRGTYVFKGSVNKFWGEKNGLTENDVEKFKSAILHMFDNDMSAARPAGSMFITDCVWWTQKNRKEASHDLFDSVEIDENGIISTKSAEITPFVHVK